MHIYSISTSISVRQASSVTTHKIVLSIVVCVIPPSIYLFRSVSKITIDTRFPVSSVLDCSWHSQSIILSNTEQNRTDFKSNNLQACFSNLKASLDSNCMPLVALHEASTDFESFLVNGCYYRCFTIRQSVWCLFCCHHICMHNKYLAYTCMCLTHVVVNRPKCDLVTIQAEWLD